MKNKSCLLKANVCGSSKKGKKYDFGPGEISPGHEYYKKYDFGPGEISPGHEIIKNTILVRAKIRFWSGRKYAFGPGEISPGHEFYV